MITCYFRIKRSAEGVAEAGRSSDEIIADLEASLNDTAEELEQQKRLNQALLRRKVPVYILSCEGIIYFIFVDVSRVSTNDFQAKTKTFL